jgi:hypothetical protein
MSKIMREVIVLGINAPKEVVDYSVKIDPRTGKDFAKDVAKDLRPKVRVIPITFLKDVDAVTEKGGYVGDVDVMRYTCPSSATELLKQFKPNVRLLLKIDQTVYEYGDKKGQVYEQVVDVVSVAAASAGK